MPKPKAKPKTKARAKAKAKAKPAPQSKYVEIPVHEPAKRLDVFLASRPELGISRSQIHKLLDAGKVLLDGEAVAAKHPLKPGQRVRVELATPKPLKLKAQNIPLKILFEDKDLLILDKPVGLVVHPGAGHADGTLVNALAHHLGPKIQALFGEERPGLVHRLDKDTSGCIVVAKSQKAFQSLSAQIASHEAGRTYLALCWGSFAEDAGLIDAPLGRSRQDRRKYAVRLEQGKEARTHFKVRERFNLATLLELKLETGRTHQIRAHLLSIGRPIIGDQDYGAAPGSTPAALRDALRKAMPRQALHAWKLKLTHPISKKAFEVEAPIPPDFEAAIKILRQPKRR